jgi:hypothetical protein
MVNRQFRIAGAIANPFPFLAKKLNSGSLSEPVRQRAKTDTPYVFPLLAKRGEGWGEESIKPPVPPTTHRHFKNQKIDPGPYAPSRFSAFSASLRFAF